MSDKQCFALAARWLTCAGVSEVSEDKSGHKHSALKSVFVKSNFLLHCFLCAENAV